MGIKYLKILNEQEHSRKDGRKSETWILPIFSSLQCGERLFDGFLRFISFHYYYYLLLLLLLLLLTKETLRVDL